MKIYAGYDRLRGNGPLALFWLGIFTIFTFLVKQVGFLKGIDEEFASKPRPFYTAVRYFSLMIFDNYGLRWVSFVALLLTSYLTYRLTHNKIYLFLPVFSLLLVNSSVALLKFLLDRSKPSSGKSTWSTDTYHSYPSGHMVNIIVMYLLIFFLIKSTGLVAYKRVRPYYYINFFMSSGFFVTSLLRNTHWLTDLIGGVFLGLALYYFCRFITLHFSFKFSLK